MKSILLIGVNRFGALLARQFYSLGHHIMAVREYGQMDLTVTPDTVLERNKTLLVLGKRKAIQKCFRM